MCSRERARARVGIPRVVCLGGTLQKTNKRKTERQVCDAESARDSVEAFGAAEERGERHGGVEQLCGAIIEEETSENTHAFV